MALGIPSGPGVDAFLIIVVVFFAYLIYRKMDETGKIGKMIKSHTGGDEEEGADTIENMDEPAYLLIKNKDNGINWTMVSCETGEDNGPDDWTATFTTDEGHDEFISSDQVRAVPHYKQVSGNVIIWEYSKNGFGDVRERESRNKNEHIKRLVLENKALKSQLMGKSIDVQEQMAMHREEAGKRYRSPTATGSRQNEKFHSYDKKDKKYSEEEEEKNDEENPESQEPDPFED